MLYDLENASGTKTETVDSLKMTCVLEEEITFPTDCNIETHNYDNPSTSNLKGTILVPYKINYIETTYALWYEVYKWALDRGYSFENPGTRRKQQNRSADSRKIQAGNKHNALRLHSMVQCVFPDERTAPGLLFQQRA